MNTSTAAGRIVIIVVITSFVFIMGYFFIELALYGVKWNARIKADSLFVQIAKIAWPAYLYLSNYALFRTGLILVV